MEYETINKETPEMKQLISGIKGLTNRVRSIAQTHRPLFEGEIYLTGREVCERLFLSPRTLQDYRDKSIIPYTQIAGKILYRLSDINRILSESYVNRNLHRQWCRSLFLSIVLVRVSQKISTFAIEYLCMLLPLDKRGRIFSYMLESRET